MLHGAAVDARAHAQLPSLKPRTLRWMSALPPGVRRRAATRWVTRHPLPAAIEQSIVDEVARCWDGVPLPRPLPRILDDARRLLLLAALDSHPAACDGPELTGRHLQVTSLGPIEALLSEGRAAVLLTPTFGAWQAIAPALARRGYRVGLLDLRADGRMPAERFPAAPGLDLRTLAVRRSVRPAVRFATEGPNLIVALGDEGRGSRWANGAMLGRSVSVGSTPFELARRLGLGLLPVFAVREKGRSRLIVDKPLKVSDTGRGDADLDTTAARWLKLVDRYARRHPEHYLPFLHLRREARLADPLPLFADSVPVREAS